MLCARKLAERDTYVTLGYLSLGEYSAFAHRIYSHARSKLLRVALIIAPLNGVRFLNEKPAKENAPAIAEAFSLVSPTSQMWNTLWPSLQKMNQRLIELCVGEDLL
jgi:hypothetical protein